MLKTRLQTNKKKIKLKMSGDLNDNNCSKNICEDNTNPSTEPNDNNIALNVINELNDLISAKRDFIISSFATKKGPIPKHQIKDYLNQMIEVVTNKKNEILGSSATTSKTTTPLSTVDCNAIDISKDCHLKTTSTVCQLSENQSLETASEKSTKSKAKTKSKVIQKSTKRRKSVGRKGIGKLLYDYRNRNRIPDYQKRLKYVERDPTIDILHKKIGLVASRLSAIPESKDEF